MPLTMLPQLDPTTAGLPAVQAACNNGRMTCQLAARSDRIAILSVHTTFAQRLKLVPWIITEQSQSICTPSMVLLLRRALLQIMRMPEGEDLQRQLMMKSFTVRSIQRCSSAVLRLRRSQAGAAAGCRCVRCRRPTAGHAHEMPVARWHACRAQQWAVCMTDRRV